MRGKEVNASAPGRCASTGVTARRVGVLRTVLSATVVRAIDKSATRQYLASTSSKTPNGLHSSSLTHCHAPSWCGVSIFESHKYMEANSSAGRSFGPTRDTENTRCTTKSRPRSVDASTRLERRTKSSTRRTRF